MTDPRCRIGKVSLKHQQNAARWPANVVAMPDRPGQDRPVSRVLAAAFESNLKTVVIAGWEQDGTPYFASSTADGGDVVWLVEKLKAAVLK